MQSLRAAERRALQQLFASRPNSFRQLYQSTKPTFRTRTSQTIGTRASLHSSRPYYTSFSNTFRRPFSRTARRLQSTTSTSTSEQSLSLSQRMRKLSREYGWSAVGVYFLLSALDFPFCFVAVRILGTDRIGHWEHVVVSTFKEWVTWPLGGTGAEDDVANAVDQTEQVVLKAPLEEVRRHEVQGKKEEGGKGDEERGGKVRLLEEDETYVVADHGYKEAYEEAAKSNASIWTQLALAYAIHKSFIFVRVPLTAAVTPKVVKTLRGWGWNIGKMPKRMKKVGKGETGVNTKGSGIKPDD